MFAKGKSFAYQRDFVFLINLFNFKKLNHLLIKNKLRHIIVKI